MLTILVFEINKGKNAQKVKKKINHPLSILVKLINNSRGKYKRNTYLINICKSDTDFVLIYISFKFDFLRKYH